MLRAIYILLFIFVSTGFSQGLKLNSDEQKTLLIGVLIEKNNLDDHVDYAPYFSKSVRPILRKGSVYSLFRNLVESEEDIDVEGVYNSYKNLLDREEVLLLYRMAKSLNEKGPFLDSLQKAYISRLDVINYVDDELENFSKPSAPELELKEDISLGEQIKLKVLTPEEDVLVVTGNSRYHIDMVKTCINQLMQNYRLSNRVIDIQIVPSKTTGVPSITPLELYMSFINGGDKSRYHYIGDFSPSGKIRPWGYMKEHLQRLEKIDKGLIYVAKSEYENLRDIVCLVGVEPIVSKQFIGESSLKKLRGIEKGGIRDNWAVDYSILARQAKSKSISKAAMLTRLGQIIKDCPDHFSARIYQDYLLNKLNTKLSLKNSYFEFEFFYRRMKQIGINEYLSKERLKEMNITNPKYVPPQLLENSKIMREFIEDLRKFSKVAHNDLKRTSEKLIEAYVLMDQLNNKMLKPKARWTGLFKKYYALLREINLSRELFIDSQKAMDGVFK